MTRDNNFTANIENNNNVSAEIINNTACIIDLFEENKLYAYSIIETDTPENSLGRVFMTEYNVKLSDDFTSDINIEFTLGDLAGQIFCLSYTNYDNIWECNTDS